MIVIFAFLALSLVQSREQAQQLPTVSHRVVIQISEFVPIEGVRNHRNHCTRIRPQTRQVCKVALDPAKQKLVVCRREQLTYGMAEAQPVDRGLTSTGSRRIHTLDQFRIIRPSPCQQYIGLALGEWVDATNLEIVHPQRFVATSNPQAVCFYQPIEEVLKPLPDGLQNAPIGQIVEIPRAFDLTTCPIPDPQPQGLESSS